MFTPLNIDFILRTVKYDHLSFIFENYMAAKTDISRIFNIKENCQNAVCDLSLYAYINFLHVVNLIKFRSMLQFLFVTEKESQCS